MDVGIAGHYTICVRAQNCSCSQVWSLLHMAFYYNPPPTPSVRAKMLSGSDQELLGSNLDWDTNCPDVLRGFTQFFQGRSWTVRLNRPLPPCSACSRALNARGLHGT
jgi:hypothetical protein